MRMRKKILAMLFAIGLLVIALPLAVRAEASGECGVGMTWTYSGGILTISGEGGLPSYTSDTSPWKSYRNSITSVKIESGVTGTGNRVFQDCTSLTSVTLPESMTYIGSETFSGCTSLESIIIPDSVTNIEYGAFEKCTNLKSVIFPQNTVNIGYAVFRYCSSLKSITLPNHVIFDDEGGAFYGCTGLESVIIPDASVIGGYTFFGCSSLKSVSLSKGVSSIGEYAFGDCNSLEILEIPKSVTNIGDGAFSRCEGLTSITIPDGVTTIAYSTFYGCENLGYISLPDSITKIERLAFSGCINLADLVIPKNVTNISDTAFEKCNAISSIEIPGCVSDIGYGAFRYCKNLKYVTISEGVKSIGQWAFGNCESLTNVVIPKSVKSIGKEAFDTCGSLASIVIPEGVSCIEEFTFSNCMNLKSVTIPSSVVKIGQYAFSGCLIRDVYYMGNDEQRKLIVIEEKNDNLAGKTWQHLHTEVIDLAMEPTYFDTGLTEGSHCSNCGETIKEQQTVPKKVLGVPVLTVTGGTDSVKLVWKQIDGATGYEIFRSTSHEGSYSKIQTVSGGSILSFADTGLSAETTYYYKIRTVATANGKTVYSSDSTILPVKTETKNQESEVTPPANPKPETYTIKTSTGKGGKANGGGTKKVGEQVTLTAIPDKGYYFAGWKENNKKVSSSQTYTFSVKKNQELTASFAKFSAPVLSKTSVDITSVKVSWKKVPGATAYEVYRANSKSGKFTKKAVISKSSTVNYTDKKLTTGKTYYYKVRAVASGTVKTTYSNYSSMKSAKPLPAKIGGVKASAGSKSVKMSWKKAAGVTGYEVYRSTSKNGKYKKVKSISKAATTKYTDKKLKAKKVYYYKVRAYKKVSGKKVYGAFSAVKSAKTKK